MKIYTKTGDKGETGLYRGPRVLKDDPRIEAYGEVDELNAVLGVLRSEGLSDELKPLLEAIQNDLFAVGAELATPDPVEQKKLAISPNRVSALEAAIDRYDAQLAPLKEFILPGGVKTAALLHLARTVCRRAERRVITLSRTPDGAVSSELIMYLNRLSDLLFVLARYENHAAGVKDIPWKKA